MPTPRRVKPKQSLGQNFLIDENIVGNIIRDLRPTLGDAIVEVGPGQGALTGRLAERAGHLLIVEIDGRVIEELRERFAAPNVVILHEDFLEVDLAEWAARLGAPLRIVGNLPYHLTSPILFKVFDAARSVRDLTIMVQREVARRIIAGPGTKEYGILSVMTRFHGTPKHLFSVSPNCFFPRPKVTSSVLQITMHPAGGAPAGLDPELFRTVVRTAFGKRRKTLRNSLRFLPYPEPTVLRVVESLSFPLEKRPEELSLEEFIELARQIARTLGRALETV
jgi:16S rRNA (adenine1518-N6/adenine1519-N6)-dimethyltransferase